MSMLKMSILPIALLATLPAAAVYSVANGTDGELPMVFSIRTGTGVVADGLGHLSTSVWSDHDVPHSTADYVIMSNYTEYVHTGGSTFDGHSLQVGTTDYSLKSSWSRGGLFLYNRGNTAVSYFNNEGLILVNGHFRVRYYNDTYIGAKVRVLSDAAHPFDFYNGNSDAKTLQAAGYLRFLGPVSGPATASIRVRGSRDNVKAFGLKVAGDWSEYYGQVVVTGEVNTTGTYFELGSIQPAELWITNTVFAGTATIHDGCLIRSLVEGEPFTVSNLVLKAGSTFTLSGDVTVDTLSMEGGATINVVPSADGLTVPSITVLNTVSVSGGAVNVAIDGFTAEVGVTNAVFNLPADASVTADDFAFTGSTTVWRPSSSPDNVTIAPDAETGRIEVVPLFCPTVTLLKSDSTSRTTENASSLTNAANWSDGREPHGGAHYNLASKSLRFYDTLPCSQNNVPTLDYVFPGLSIATGSGAYITFICKSVTVTNLYVRGAGAGLYTPAYIHPVWHGPLDIAGGASLNMNIGYSKQLTWDGAVSGAGNITVRGLNGGSTSSPSGSVRFPEFNTNFSGTVTITIPVGVNSDPTKSTPQFAPGRNKFFTCYVADGRNLGGAMSPANPKGIVIQNMCRLAVTDDVQTVTFDEPTRGIFIDWVGRFYLTAGRTLVVNSPLAVHGTMHKEGDGLLTLGSAVKFGEDGTLDQWEEDEDATNHTFVVHGGDVRILNADALNGLNVTVSNTASAFRLPFSSADADLKAYGIRNVKTDTPFAVAVDGAKLNIQLDPPEELPRAQDTFGLVTVPLDQTNAVAQLLKVYKPESGFDGFGLKFSLVANEDGETATFKATVKTHGTLFTIR